MKKGNHKYLSDLSDISSYYNDKIIYNQLDLCGYLRNGGEHTETFVGSFIILVARGTKVNASEASRSINALKPTDSRI